MGIWAFPGETHDVHKKLGEISSQPSEQQASTEEQSHVGL